jgi:predicted permease
MMREDPAADVREEIEAHFEGTVEMLVTRGWTVGAAQAEARRRFGDVQHHRAALERYARRRSLRRRTIETARMLAVTVRSAVRGVMRSPGLSLAVVLTLALGLGANAAIFQVVDRLLLSPPPGIDRPDEVRRLHLKMQRDGEEHTISQLSYADVALLRDALPQLRMAAVMSFVPETMGTGADAVRLRVARVDAEYFPLLGVRPQLGRGLTPEDHAAGAAVIVLSHAVWQSHFGGDAAVLGRRIRAARGEYEIVGVMPPSFIGSHAPASDLWVPVEADGPALWGAGWRTDPSAIAFHVLARVPPGTPSAAWEARATTALRESETLGFLGAELLAVTTSSLVPGDAPNPASTIPVSRWLAGVSLLVLIIACANTANLFLADGERQQRETAVRLALGAGTRSLRTELFVRALILASLGAAGAVLFAFWGGQMLAGLFTPDIEPAARPATIRLLAFTGLLGVAAALLAGFIPALRVPSDVRQAMESGVRVAQRAGNARRMLAGIQVALCMILVVGAGLFVTSFANALRLDLGFAHDRLIVLRLEREDSSGLAQARLVHDAREQVLRVPGVESASGTVAVPFMLMYGLSAALPDGARIADMHVNTVGDDYFRTLGLDVEHGRALDARDAGEGAEPVVVVSRRAAARLWPGQDPLGQCLRVGDDGPCARVVGVAGDHAGVNLAAAAIAPTATMQAWVAAGFPGAQQPSSLLVRTSESPARVLQDVRRAAVVPGVRYVEAETIADLIAREMQQWRLGAAVFSLFAVIALIVAAVGLYGVLSFEVSQRRREFGIRAALGAGRMRIIQPVVTFVAPVVATGIGAGSIAALVGARRLEGLLFGVGSRDPLVFAGAALAIIVVAGIALVLPAWRAAVVDPRESLADGA